MEQHAEKLVKYILAMNLSAGLTAVALFLIHGLAASIAGFFLGMVVSGWLIRRKNERNSSSAGVIGELARKAEQRRG